MLGTIINAAGIILGGLAGCFLRKQPSAASQNYLKVLLGSVTMLFGLRLVWLGLNGTIGQVARQIIIALLALIVGRLIGKLIGLQKFSNHLGRNARDTIARTANGNKPAWSDGFNTCAMLFCAAPLAIFGAVSDGLGNHWQPLVVKAVMDGMATMGFVAMFGGSVTLAALPVLAYQGTISLLCLRYAQPWLSQHGLVESVILTDGWLIVFVALVIFEIRRIELADYLPALAVAPLLAWFWPGTH